MWCLCVVSVCGRAPKTPLILPLPTRTIHPATLCHLFFFLLYLLVFLTFPAPFLNLIILRLPSPPELKAATYDVPITHLSHLVPRPTYLFIDDSDYLARHVSDFQYKLQQPPLRPPSYTRAPGRLVACAG